MGITPDLTHFAAESRKVSGFVQAPIYDLARPTRPAPLQPQPHRGGLPGRAGILPMGAGALGWGLWSHDVFTTKLDIATGTTRWTLSRHTFIGLVPVPCFGEPG